MSPRASAARVAIAALAAMTLAACDASTATSPTPAAGAKTSPVLVVTPAAIVPLYQQSPTESYVRLCFDPFLCADDFVVPSGATWSVSDLALIGTGSSFPTQVQLHRDAGGFPGTLLMSFTTPPLIAEGRIKDYQIALPSPVVLTAGTYWIATRNFGWGVVKPPVNTWASGIAGGAWFRFPEEDFAFRLYTRQTPSGSIEALRLVIAGLGLNHGIANSLDAKLEAALDALASDDETGACGVLQALLNQVRAQRAKQIPASDADAISAAVAAIRAQIGC